MKGHELLVQSPLFASLSDIDRARLEKQLLPRHYGKNDYLFFEGDPANWLVFVVKGRVKMIKHSESGRETILATFGAGQIVGEVAVLTGEVYPATAQALEPTFTLHLPRQAYTDLVRSDPELAWALITELGRRLEQAHETIRSMAVEKVERRVARVILRLANSTGERLEGGAVRITVPLGTSSCSSPTNWWSWPRSYEAGDWGLGRGRSAAAPDGEPSSAWLSPVSSESRSTRYWSATSAMV